MTNNNERYFSTEIKTEWKIKLGKYNIHDALDHLKFAQEKLLFSILDMNAYYHVKGRVKEDYDKWNRELFEKGEISHLPIVTIDYFSTQVPSEFLLSKICTNYFNSVHSFFDNYAYFLHRCLYPNESVPRRLYFSTFLSNKLIVDSSKSAITKAISKYTSRAIYNFVNDIDNINKHLGTISPNSTLVLNDGSFEVEIPQFDKDGRTHAVIELEEALESAYELLIDFYNEITSEVMNYLV